MRNPAAVHAVEECGGAYEIVKLPSGGEVGIVTLPDGEVIEEWALYRRSKGVRQIKDDLRDEIDAEVERIRERNRG